MYMPDEDKCSEEKENLVRREHFRVVAPFSAVIGKACLVTPLKAEA
jgi:hypothetical protein